jgi:XTP/dITP diphosphohydrolase
MARPLVLATGNKGKVAEFQALLGPAGFRLLTPPEVGFQGDVEESGATFRENALLKAQALAALSPHPVLSDDSGLEVEALGGAPGLYSARYAALDSGPPGPWLDAAGLPLPTAVANRTKLLKALEGVSDRRARFRCMLCYLAPGAAPGYFEGVCEGEVILAERGGIRSRYRTRRLYGNLRRAAGRRQGRHQPPGPGGSRLPGMAGHASRLSLAPTSRCKNQ